MRHPILATGCLLLVLVFGSCSGLTGIEDLQAEFRTDRSEYSIGEEMIRTLTNAGDAKFGFNLCFAGLERQVDGTWESRGVDGDACILITNVLAPGEVVTDTLTVADARYEPGGTYRFVTRIGVGHGEEKVVHSNSFTVTE